jgi:hypothetical protein
MIWKLVSRYVVLAAVVSLPPLCLGQQSSKLLTNADVISMVKSKLPESVVVQAIQTHPGKFDTSATALIALHHAGVTEAELNAMMAASPQGSAGVAAPAIPANPTATESPAFPPSKSRMPQLMVAQGSSTQELKLEKTQLAETKTKPSSMKNLAADSAVTQAMQAGVNTVAWDTAAHINSPVGGQTVQEAGTIFSGVLGHRTPTVTYVWGVPGPASSNVLPSTKPSFTLNFSRAIGVNPDEYEPVIVKLTPAQNTCRIVGATQGKEDVRSTPAEDWQMYSHFLEERVAATSQKLGPGKYKIAANAELQPGEYGVALRPVSKGKKFSGGDVARAQGDGLMFDAIWTFRISDEAE